MARILGFTYGELRGKIGGTVYSRNKSGAYARAKVTPVNPQTVRQQTARYNFGNMSILYQNLSAAAKDCWQVFASTHFNPLKGNNTGIYTGGNAFVALRQSARHGNDYRVLPTGLSATDPLTIVAAAYQEATEPPPVPSSATLVNNVGSPFEFSITSIAVTENGIVNFDISKVGGTPVGGVEIDEFKNAEGENFGISFYMSNNLKFEGSKPNTALKLNFADSGVITSIQNDGANVSMASPINLTVASGIDKANTRDFPCQDDWILVTPVLRFEKGQQKLMAPQYVQVSA
jgi:hypothetical protein